MDPSARFSALVEEFSGDPHVTPPEDGAAPARRFGSNGLKVHDKIFAMLSRDQLIVKLPKSRVDALVAAGEGERMVSGGNRQMKEWLVVAGTSQLDWSGLAHEARQYVAAQNGEP